MWNSILGSYTACSQVAEGGKMPLWYPHFDNLDNFDDWVPFAGWLKPTIKQYKDTTSICGAEVDFNFMN